MDLEHSELVLDRFQIAKHITGIRVLRDQFECHLFTTTTDQDVGYGVAGLPWAG